MLFYPVSKASLKAWAVLVGTAAALAACGGSEPTRVEEAGLNGEYVSVTDGETCTVLVLENDGGFLVLEEERDGGRRMRPDPTPLATGTWRFSDGYLALAGDGWTAGFAADSTSVETSRRAGRLSSLRWLTSSEGSPFSACDLVSASGFDDLIDPSESESGSDW